MALNLFWLAIKSSPHENGEGFPVWQKTIVNQQEHCQPRFMDTIAGTTTFEIWIISLAEIRSFSVTQPWFFGDLHIFLSNLQILTQPSGKGLLAAVRDKDTLSWWPLTLAQCRQRQRVKTTGFSTHLVISWRNFQAAAFLMTKQLFTRWPDPKGKDTI